MKIAQQSYSCKISARLTEKQRKAVEKNAKANKMSIAEYIRACVL